MSYNATGNPASKETAALLDEGSFVEIGGAVTARSTDFNLQAKETPSDGVITGYGVIERKPCVCIQSGCNCIKGNCRRNACKENCQYL